VLARVESEALLQYPGDGREAGHAADQEDIVEIRHALVARAHDGTLGHRHGPLKQFSGQILDLGPGELQLRHPAAEPQNVPPGLGCAQLSFQPLRGNEQVLHELRVFFRMGPGVLLGDPAEQISGDDLAAGVQPLVEDVHEQGGHRVRDLPSGGYDSGGPGGQEGRGERKRLVEVAFGRIGEAGGEDDESARVCPGQIPWLPRSRLPQDVPHLDPDLAAVAVLPQQ
jgi:hypothetical protein